MKLPKQLLELSIYLKKLPGVGTRTAERFAFDLLHWDKKEIQALGASLLKIQEEIPPCSICHCLTEKGVCAFCQSVARNRKQLCIVSSQKDPFAIEATRSYQGLYHVIENLLSPLDGRHLSSIDLGKIERRIEEEKVEELIIAFDSTLEGDTTALYFKEKLDRPSLRIVRLAFGIPLGSSLESIDGGTLTKAFSGRQSF